MERHSRGVASSQITTKVWEGTFGYVAFVGWWSGMLTLVRRVRATQ